MHPLLLKSLEGNKYSWTNKHLHDELKQPSVIVDSPPASSNSPSKVDAINSPVDTNADNKTTAETSEDRFIPKDDDPNKPVMYTKKGQPIKGEWVGSVFVRYRKGTPRPSDFTSEDWQRLGDAGRRAVLKQIAEEKTKDGKQKNVAACFSLYAY